MKITRPAALVLVCLAWLSLPSGSQTPGLSKKYETWLDRDVVTILSPEDRDAFGKLATDRDRDLFIEEFWRQRDPTPGTPRNEFREEQARRINYVNERFGGEGSPPGWKTDRGRTLILLGPPLDVRKFATPDICPIEIWYYLRELRRDRPTLFRLLFFEEYGAEEFKLYNPVSDGAKRLVPFPEQRKSGTRSVPAETAGEGMPFPAGWTAADKQAYRILAEAVTGELAEASISSFPGLCDPGQALRSAQLLAEIESSPRNAIRPMESALTLSVLQDPLGPFLANYVIAPEILSLDFFQDRYFAGLRTRIRATDAEGKSVLQTETFTPIEMTRDELKTLAENSLELYGAFPLSPGTYTLNLVLENTVSKESASVEKKISVPDGRRLQMGQLVLARDVVRDTSGGAGRAFQVGAVQLYPSLMNIFSAKDHLFLFFQMYGLSPELIEQGSLEYSILSGGTILQASRRKVGDSDNRRDFLQEFTLDAFVPGAYAVKAALLDKDGREVLAETTGFTVSAKPLRGSWVVAADR